MDGTIKEYNGKLIIVNQWQTHFTEPIQYRQYWPTNLSTKDWSHLIDLPVKYLGAGMYQFSNGTRLHLADGKETTPIHTESLPIKKPRGKSKYQWRYGKWQ